MHRPTLVPLEARGTTGFVDALRRTWDAGDAVLPLDPRLPEPARRRLAASLGAGQPVEQGDALVVATSGTTGEPKGAVLTHASLQASAAATSARLGVDPASDRWLACLPLAHMGGLGVVIRALHTGTPLELHEEFDATAVDRAALDGGASLVSLVATALARLQHAGRFRAILLGGGPAPAIPPPNAVLTYGLTESGGGVVYDGRPLDGVEVAIDASGQILLRGPMLLRCYRDGTDPRIDGGWFPTGDLGSFDPTTGRLTVHGRAADVIVTGGEKVWPASVEAILAELPAVADVAVVGRPDAEWGARVVALVVPSDPTRPPSIDDIRLAVRERLGPWAAPRELELVEAIPRTALGKVRRDGSAFRTPGR